MSIPILDLKSQNISNLHNLFKENGFVRIDGVFDEGELDEMRQAMEKIVDEMNVDEHPKSVFSTYDENKQIVKNLNMVQPQIVQSMYIFKQPSIGGAVTDHIDATFLQVNPIKNVVGVWIAVDDAEIENGCLWFIPGSHKTESLDYRFVRTNPTNSSEPLLKFTGEKPVYDQTKFIPVPVPKGSLVLIDGMVVHKSEPNTSQKSRHAYTFHVVDAHETKWSELNWLQPTSTYKFPNLYDN
uniref:Uncharacterized protein n=1 Tax=Panagrolaimus sp. ES5 TaxID=591445 RepID=A0AC34F2S1_9BILA